MLQRKRLKAAKRWAKIGKWAMSGKNKQAPLNLMRTRTLPCVTAETPENEQTKGENMETDDVGRKRASVA
jgi:hypothetical protein